MKDDKDWVGAKEFLKNLLIAQSTGATTPSSSDGLASAISGEQVKLSTPPSLTNKV